MLSIKEKERHRGQMFNKKIKKIALWGSEMQLLELIVALQNVCDTVRF